MDSSSSDDEEEVMLYDSPTSIVHLEPSWNAIDSGLLMEGGAGCRTAGPGAAALDKDCNVVASQAVHATVDKHGVEGPTQQPLEDIQAGKGFARGSRPHVEGSHCWFTSVGWLDGTMPENGVPADARHPGEDGDMKGLARAESAKAATAEAADPAWICTPPRMSSAFNGKLQAANVRASSSNSGNGSISGSDSGNNSGGRSRSCSGSEGDIEAALDHKAKRSKLPVMRNRNYHVPGKYRGVRCRREGRFSAEIKVGNVRRWLGTFSTAEEAARAFDKAAMQVSGRNARLNFPPQGDTASDQAKRGGWASGRGGSSSQGYQAAGAKTMALHVTDCSPTASGQHVDIDGPSTPHTSAPKRWRD